jgi:crotonobetainyl-CoA:carnitine CoA-transferase CaiB-like acyl-CoA transferase
MDRPLSVIKRREGLPTIASHAVTCVDQQGSVVVPGALTGITVVDFGCFIAGPLLGELLAQNGADVLHVDPPGGPPLAGLPDAYLNRGKRRVTLDLRNDRQRRLARQLALSSDVLIENFRPGVMDRLGLSSEELRAANPALVYCSLPGFAASDPRASIQAWEGVVMSATAGYRRLGEHWDWKARTNVESTDPGRPLFTGLPIASTTAAMLGALRVVTALLQRDRTGQGASIEVPLSEAMLEMVGFHLDFPDFVGHREDLPRPFLGSYKTSDGRFVDSVSYPRFIERFLASAGVWEAWKNAGLSDLATVFADPDLKVVAERRFAELICSRPAADWEAIAARLGIPFAMVRTPDEWLTNDQARKSGAIVEVDDPEFGPISMAGQAFHFSETPVHVAPRTLHGSVSDGRFPDLDRVSVGQPGERPRDDEAPLAGISVLEMSQVVAGPIAGRLLADYGADVIKIANPLPGGNNGFHGSYTNRGKRTAFLNVQDPADRDILQSIAGDVDVLLQNYAFGAIERYGLGFDDELRKVRTDLVYVSLSAFSREGPWQARRGHENQAVAATGLSSRYGGHGGWPIYQPYLVNDVGTGIMGALAAVLGLYRRAKTGHGQHISTSLSHVATMHQGIYLFGGLPTRRATEPTGPDALGWSALQRLYQASDGWLFLAATPDQITALVQVLALPEHVADSRQIEKPQGPLAVAVAARIHQETREHWIHALAARGITAQAVREISEVANDPTWHRRGVLRYHRNGEGKDNVPVLGLGAVPWPVAPRSVLHPGTLGADTSAVRSEYRSDTHVNT